MDVNTNRYTIQARIRERHAEAATERLARQVRAARRSAGRPTGPAARWVVAVAALQRVARVFAAIL